MAYSTIDIFTGGTPSAVGNDSSNPAETTPGENAVDNANATHWANGGTSGWWKYDLGVGVTKRAEKFTVYVNNTGNWNIKDFTFQGSNNDSDWTTLKTVTGRLQAETGLFTYTFTNATSYRYYKIDVTANWGGGAVMLWEVSAYATLVVKDIIGGGIIPSTR